MAPDGGRKRQHRGAGQGGRPRPKPNASPDDVAFGVNPCAMAVSVGAARRLLYVEDSVNPRVTELVDQARDQGITTEGVTLDRLDQLSGGGVHQGVLVRLRELEETDLRGVAARATGASLALLLDGITDPQNVGAVLRTAVATGIDAVVLPRRRGAQLTPGVHRASAGLSFLAPVAAPQNLSQAVDILKEAGYWVAAAAGGEGAEDATQFDWPQKTALIVGSEGEGVSSLLLKRADFRVALPMDPRVESLNVGVATGALSYLWRRQWPFANSGSNG
ncbi:MAG: 23S rRNA (guanosine(2251)-2'-O)-methyltransferase RlmB [Dehalococcoidia bacterium]|nr:23S rRNA (guanosine(2251)-2'-O)-methyltransferase RlmB [Dehalococcoidia bacterium]